MMVPSFNFDRKMFILKQDGKSGHTPLHHAIDYENCEVLQLLVTKGANVNKPNYSGITPVQSANSCRNDAISKILVSQEAATAAGPAKLKTTTTFTTTGTTSSDSNSEKVNGTLAFHTKAGSSEFNSG